MLGTRIQACFAVIIALATAPCSAHIEGSTIAIVKDGAIVYARGYGERDVSAKLPADVGPPSAQAFYAAAVRAMDDVPQPAFVTYRLEGESDNIHIGLQTARHQVWLRFASGLASTVWNVKHRTPDYESEIMDGDGDHRYVSQRSIFDPTWFGAFRALRDGMLGYQDVETGRNSLTIAQPTPAPDPSLKTIDVVSVIGPGTYAVQDRGPAACSNGDPGHALHLVSRRRDPRHQLTDVVVDLHSMRFCSIRYEWSSALWFNGTIEQDYANVHGYWMVTGGLLDGTLRILGIPTRHFVWHYRLLDMAFPKDLPAAAFVADPTQ